MRFLEDIALFLVGLAAALATVSLFRIGLGIWTLVQLPVIFLAIAVFYLNDKRLASLTVGFGLGLDIVSAYTFFSWTCILGGTTLVGWWLSRTVFTNRSLPSLLLLGASMRLAYFILQIALSRAGELFGGTVWYLITGVAAWRSLFALGVEMALLVVIFVMHIVLRGERARMLTHL
jgi:hypothetical protein